MEKLKALLAEAKVKALPVFEECRAGTKPFFYAAAYVMLCIGWALAVPFALAADFLKLTGEKIKPELPKKP